MTDEDKLRDIGYPPGSENNEVLGVKMPSEPVISGEVQSEDTTPQKKPASEFVKIMLKIEAETFIGDIDKYIQIVKDSLSGDPTIKHTEAGSIMLVINRFLESDYAIDEEKKTRMLAIKEEYDAKRHANIEQQEAAKIARQEVELKKLYRGLEED